MFLCTWKWDGENIMKDTRAYKEIVTTPIQKL